jgi:membrane protein DedA with SNARE-associated domain
MNFGKFVIFTFLGSFPWSAGLAWAGAAFPPEQIRNAMRPFDIPIIAIVLILIGIFVYRSLRERKKGTDANPELA